MMRFGGRRTVVGALVGSVFLALSAGAAAAQEVPRVPVLVDYVGVEGVYLTVGTEQGAQAGDTLTVYASDTDLTPLGILVLTAAARVRSVATMVGPSFDLASGDEIFIPLAPVVVAAEPTDQPTVPAVVVTQAERTTETGGPSMSGRISFNVDARETRTSWEGDLFGTTRRRFATPVTSLSLRIADLPGGVRVETNVRASYRYSDGVAIQPERSVRIYNVTAIKTFENAPLEFRLGRFYNPYEPYSAYWDGALMRVGGRSGPGIGIVAGFEPQRGNEGFSQDVSKITGFADFSARGGSWSYTTDMSFHVVRSDVAGLFDQTFAGWSQQLSLGRITFNQRLRMDREEGTTKWSLAQLRVRAGLAITGPLRLNVAYSRMRPGLFRGLLPVLSPERQEITAGFSIFEGRRSLMFDVGTTQWADEARGLSFSGSASAYLGPLQIYASGRHWSRTGMSTIAAAPGVGFAWGWLATRLGYQRYQTKSTETFTSQSGTIDFTATPTGAFWITLGGEQQWGSTFEGTRLRFSVGKSF
ncbi:MAG: hypothetical protein OEO79_19210 [Gemmatimonadota bacterium]|nr:hypothetical protein [Gemmatimonadota bacterium]MDH3421555.1 hypothetical protein [Gemmatimonadota bacterium]